MESYVRGVWNICDKIKFGNGEIFIITEIIHSESRIHLLWNEMGIIEISHN